MNRLNSKWKMLCLIWKEIFQKNRQQTQEHQVVRNPVRNAELKLHGIPPITDESNIKTLHLDFYLEFHNPDISKC